MISYCDNLYVTDKTRRKLPKIIKAINDKKILKKGYIIILSLTENDVFDIIPHYMVKSLSDKNIDFKVLGFAEDKDAAVALCSEMSAEYIESGENKTMREYFKNK